MIAKTQKQLESLEAVERERETTLYFAWNLSTRPNWDKLTNRLEISSLNLVRNKQRRLGQHTKSMCT